MAGLKTILVPLGDAVDGGPVLTVAFQIAKTFAAHVDVLHLRADPASVIPLVGEGMSGTLIEELMASAAEESDKRAAEARALFDEKRQETELPLIEMPFTGHGPSTAWLEKTGREEEEVVVAGRASDLILIGRSRVEGDPTLNAAVIDSGRPVLVVPPETSGEVGRRITIAWNGSAEATRAIAAAMPFLEAAEAVTLLAFEDAGEGHDMAAHLGWHGIRAKPETLEVSVTDIGYALIQQAATHKADMLVMGAYTHSRLRRLILGGVTRYVLENATVPVLMSH